MRTDGYHEIRSLVTPISLADEISFQPSDEVTLSVESPVAEDLSRIGPVESNLAFRAASLLKRVTGCRKGVSMVLSKHIPVGSGLGGGSADAAAVLNGLNAFWDLGVDRNELVRLGAELGSDVPALVMGGITLMEGRGERVTEEPRFPSFDLVLVFPGIFTSTAKVYKNCVPQLTNGGQILDNMRHALFSGEASAVAAALFNGLTEAAEALHPEIAHARSALLATGALGASMSGSGSCVFGLVRDLTHATALARNLCRAGLDARVAHTCPVM